MFLLSQAQVQTQELRHQLDRTEDDLEKTEAEAADLNVKVRMGEAKIY